MMTAPSPSRTEMLRIETHADGSMTLQVDYLGRPLMPQGRFPFVASIDGKGHLLENGYLGRALAAPSLGALLNWNDGVAMLRDLSGGNWLRLLAAGDGSSVGEFSLAHSKQASRDLIACTVQWLK